MDIFKVKDGHLILLAQLLLSPQSSQVLDLTYQCSMQLENSLECNLKCLGTLTSIKCYQHMIYM